MLTQNFIQNAKATATTGGVNPTQAMTPEQFQSWSQPKAEPQQSAYDKYYQKPLEKVRDVAAGAAGAVLNPVVGLGKEAAAGIAGNKMSGEVNDINKSLSDADTNYLKAVNQNLQKAKSSGDIATVKRYTDVIKNFHLSSGVKMSDLVPAINDTNEQVVGNALGTILAATSGGALESGAAGVKEAPTLIKALTSGAKVGGTVGAVSGVSSAMRDNASVGGVVKGGVVGGVIGAGTGAALSGAAYGIGKGVKALSGTGKAPATEPQSFEDAKNAISNSKSSVDFDSPDKTFKEFGINKADIFNKDGTFNAETELGKQALQGRVDDVAQKLAAVNPELESQFREAVANNPQSLDSLQSTALDMLRENDPKSAFVKDLITPKQSTKDLTSAIKTGKVTEGEGVLGNRDVTKSIPNFSDIQDAVSKVEGVSPDKTLLENSNAIHDEIGSVAEDLKSQLANDKSSFTPKEFNKYMKGVKSDLADNPTIVGDAEKTATKILNKFNNLVDENGYTPSGLLESRKQLDSWMTSQKGSNVFDPATESAVSTALRAIRQGGNDFLAERVPNVAVKDMLQNQTQLYNAIDAIAPKAAKEGANGFQQFVKANPTLIKALKYGAITVGGGEILKHTGLLP